MVDITAYLPIITLNVNGLNYPMKRHRLADWIKKQAPSNLCVQEMQLTGKDKHRLRVKEWKKIFQENGAQAIIAILIFHKEDSKSKLVRSHKDYHVILIKRTI
jgi:exonuclease III